MQNIKHSVELKFMEIFKRYTSFLKTKYFFNFHCKKTKKDLREISNCKPLKSKLKSHYKEGITKSYESQ